MCALYRALEFHHCCTRRFRTCSPVAHAVHVHRRRASVVSVKQNDRVVQSPRPKSAGIHTESAYLEAEMTPPKVRSQSSSAALGSFSAAALARDSGKKKRDSGKKKRDSAKKKRDSAKKKRDSTGKLTKQLAERRHSCVEAATTPIQTLKSEKDKGAKPRSQSLAVTSLDLKLSSDNREAQERQKQTAEKLAAAGWESKTTDDGRVFYFHRGEQRFVLFFVLNISVCKRDHS